MTEYLIISHDCFLQYTLKFTNPTIRHYITRVVEKVLLNNQQNKNLLNKNTNVLISTLVMKNLLISFIGITSRVPAVLLQRNSTDAYISYQSSLPENNS
jgi:hypothetical protein